MSSKHARCSRICTRSSARTLRSRHPLCGLHSTRTDFERSFGARDKFPSFRRAPLREKKKKKRAEEKRKNREKGEPSTLIRVSVDHDGAACRRRRRRDEAAGVHDISIRKRRKRFIAIFFFFSLRLDRQLLFFRRS